MIPRSVLLVALALTSVSAATEERELQPKTGINLCAAYDNVVPIIVDGSLFCECEGRTIACDFERICNEDDSGDCANLVMKMDFSTPEAEYISYTTTYSNNGIEPVQVVLEVSSDLTAGISSCTATIGDLKECTCDVCAEGKGVDIDCGQASGNTKATTSGCTLVNVEKLQRFVPFFGKSNNLNIAKTLSESGGFSKSATLGVIVAASMCLLALATV